MFDWMSGIGGRAVALSVTVLNLLGLWPSAFRAVGWGTWGGYGQHLLEVGRAALLTCVYFHKPRVVIID